MVSTSEESTRSGMEETRQRIIVAAIRVFAQKGYMGATTRAIAAEAGVNEVTLFRHFGNKENLLKAAVDYYSPLPGLENLLKYEFTGDYSQDLLRLGSFFISRLAEPWQTVERRKILLMTLQEVDRRPEMRDLILPLFERVRRLLREYLVRQVDQGSVRNLNPDIMAEAILGMFFSYALMQPLLTHCQTVELPLEDLVAQFVDIFTKGTFCGNGLVKD